jgi:uncharacterized RDD family membrane protein YckC
MRGRYRNEEPGDRAPSAAPVFRAPAAAVAGGGVIAVENPYQTPRAPALRHERPAAGSEALASRGARLAASLIDGLAMLVILLPAFAVMFVGAANESLSSAALLFAGISGIAILVFAIYQIRLLVQQGQSLGKKAMNIRIVNYADGGHPSAGRLLGLRYVVNSALAQFIPLYGLIDVLLIFGSERRCIHDYLAGTKVVET